MDRIVETWLDKTVYYLICLGISLSSCTAMHSSMHSYSYASFHAVARIALVKPEKARGVEDVILRAAQMGQIVEKVAIRFLMFRHICF